MSLSVLASSLINWYYFLLGPSYCCRFVSFRSESEAKAALLAIKDCRFEGKPIRARLKTESALKSYYRWAIVSIIDGFSWR